MVCISFIDVQLVSNRVARSALPDAPVIEDEPGRRVRSGRKRRAALGSRQG
jgi:hypothetical protein